MCLRIWTKIPRSSSHGDSLHSNLCRKVIPRTIHRSSLLGLSKTSVGIESDAAVKKFLTDDFTIPKTYHNEFLKSIKSFRGTKNITTIDDLRSLERETIDNPAQAAEQSQVKKKRKKFQARPSVPVTVKIPHLGLTRSLQWKLGESLLHLARNNKDMFEDHMIEGACGGSASCSTCHVYIYQKAFHDLLDEPSVTELDMIDLAFEPREGSSRLGCQVRLTPQIIDNFPDHGLEFEIPERANNLWVPYD